MADYTQSPYGLPFPIAPPPDHLQNATFDPQRNAQAGPADPRQPAFPEGFNFGGSLPGLNLHAFSQNNQQPQYPWPPPPPPQQPNPFGSAFPPPFLTQNGYPIPPPPPPGSNFFPPVPQFPMQNAPVPSPTIAQPTPSVPALPQPAGAIDNRLVGMLDIDKEEGELSEGDASKSRAGLDMVTKEPPRSVPDANKDDVWSGHRQRFASPDYQPAGRDYPTTRTMPRRPSSATQKAPVSQPANTLSQKREEAKSFIRLLHQNKIGYSMLAAEGLDDQLLRGVYKDLNLPSAPPKVISAPSPKQKIAETAKAAAAEKSTAPVLPQLPATKTNGQTLPPKPPLPVKTNVNPTPPSNSAASPIDRKDYIARLQAAKLAKQSNTAKVASPQLTPPIVESGSTASTTAVQPPPAGNAVTGSATKGGKSKEEKARQTEIIRKRLELLKASGKLNPSGQSTPVLPGASTPASTAASVSSPNQQNDLSQLQSFGVPPADPNGQSSAGAAFPTLPGLFMNSSNVGPETFRQKRREEVSTRPAGKTAEDANGTSRKRPVASDFDEVSTPRGPGPVYTRPLGQSPHEHDGESMIIEVTDDESEASDKDLDGDTAMAHSSGFNLSGSNRNGTHSFRNIPPLSDFPSRSASARPGSAFHTPPVARTPTIMDQVMLNEKEKEILQMKLKIAEMSRKRKTTAAQKDAIDSSPAAQKVGAAPDSSQMNASAQSTPGLLPSALPGIASAVPAFQTHKRPLDNAGTPESKRQRRAAINSTLHSLETELDIGRARLIQLEKELVEARAAHDQKERQRDELIKELESYGIDTEGMPDEELQAHKDELELQKTIESTSQSSAAKQAITPHEPLLTEDHPIEEPEPVEQEVPLMDSGDVATSVESSIMKSAPVSAPAPEEVMLDTPAQSTIIAENSAQTGAPQPIVDGVTIPAAPPAETVDATTPVDDDADFYSPEPAAPPTTVSQPTIEQCAQDVKSLSEEGEVEMSVSPSPVDDEEEYEPEEPQIMADEKVSTSQNQEPQQENPAMTTQSPLSTTSLEDEGDAYEPPAANEIIPEAPYSAEETFSPRTHPVDEDEPRAMDISTSSSDESESQSSPSDTEQPASISFNHPLEHSVGIADDLAPELQPEPVPADETVVEQLSAPEDHDVDPTRFVPYESPLRMFKSYRYHSQYSQDVAGGFLSMTYSHQIDPTKPLCRFESVGGTCNDSQCDGQHFQSMGITGEKLLVQLGTANPGKTPEERNKWNDGLRQVLKELRQNNIKDPNGIAAEIAKYRRQFFQDDTRVVNL